MSESGNSDDLVAQLRSAIDDGLAWEAITERFGPKLRALIQFRMQPRLRGRVDPSDILQETYVDATRRLAEYLTHPQVPFYIWLRSLAVQRLITLQRRHLGAEVRDARREVSLHGDAYGSATSEALAAALLGQRTSPSSAAVIGELRLQLEAALNDLDDIDREILVPRHFEEMTNAEAAAALGLSPQRREQLLRPRSGKNGERPGAHWEWPCGAWQMSTPGHRSVRGTSDSACGMLCAEVVLFDSVEYRKRALGVGP